MAKHAANPPLPRGAASKTARTATAKTSRSAATGPLSQPDTGRPSELPPSTVTCDAVSSLGSTKKSRPSPPAETDVRSESVAFPHIDVTHDDLSRRPLERRQTDEDDMEDLEIRLLVDELSAKELSSGAHLLSGKATSPRTAERARWRAAGIATAVGFAVVVLFTSAQAQLGHAGQQASLARHLKHDADKDKSDGSTQHDALHVHNIHNTVFNGAAPQAHTGDSPRDDGYTVDKIIDQSQRPGGGLMTIAWKRQNALLSKECEAVGPAHTASRVVEAVLRECSEINAPKYRGVINILESRPTRRHCTLVCEQALRSYRTSKCAPLEVELMPAEKRMAFLRIEMLATSYCWDDKCKAGDRIHHATDELVQVSQACNGGAQSEADASRDSTCTDECRDALRAYQDDPCTAWALHHTPKPEDLKADFLLTRMHIHNMCILVDQQPEEDEHPDASDPYGPVPYDCNDIEQQGNVSDAIFGIKMLCPDGEETTECDKHCRSAVLAFEYTPCVTSVLQSFGDHGGTTEEQSYNFRKNYVGILTAVQHLAHLCVLSNYGISTPAPTEADKAMYP